MDCKAYSFTSQGKVPNKGGIRAKIIIWNSIQFGRCEENTLGKNSQGQIVSWYFPLALAMFRSPYNRIIWLW